MAEFIFNIFRRARDFFSRFVSSAEETGGGGGAADTVTRLASWMLRGRNNHSEKGTRCRIYDFECCVFDLQEIHKIQ